MHRILTEADIDSLFAAPLAVLYKHSPICSTSGVARDEIAELRRQREVPVYIVDVVRERPLSRALAERTGVAHESPQAIVLRAGVATWHRSHYDIRADAIGRALDQLAAMTGGDAGPS